MDIFILKKMGSIFGHFSKAKKKKPCRIGWWSPPLPDSRCRPHRSLCRPPPSPLWRSAWPWRYPRGWRFRATLRAGRPSMSNRSIVELHAVLKQLRARRAWFAASKTGLYISQSTGLRRVILTKARLGIPLLGAYPISTLTWRQLTIESWDAGGYLRLGEDLADFPPNLLENENASQSCSSWGSSYGFII